FLLHFPSTPPSPTAISPPSLHDALPICQAPIDVELDAFSELLPRFFAGARRRLTLPVRARRSDRTKRLCKEAGDRMCRHAKRDRSEEYTSQLQSRFDLVCRLLLEKKKN